MTETEDQAAIHTIVVTAADLVSALETNYRGRAGSVVLRITPPFSGRMRARLHRAPEAGQDESDPVLLDPQSLVEAGCPVPPEPDAVEDILRSDPEETYTIDAQRERYEHAIQRWRGRVLDQVRDSIVLADTGTESAVRILGTIDEA